MDARKTLPDAYGTFRPNRPLTLLEQAVINVATAPFYELSPRRRALAHFGRGFLTGTLMAAALNTDGLLSLVLWIAVAWRAFGWFTWGLGQQALAERRARLDLLSPFAWAMLTSRTSFVGKRPTR